MASSVFNIIFLFFLGSYTLISLLSYDKYDNSFFIFDSERITPENFLGNLGAYTSDLLFRTFGIVSYIIPITLLF